MEGPRTKHRIRLSVDRTEDLTRAKARSEVGHSVLIDTLCDEVVF